MDLSQPPDWANLATDRRSRLTVALTQLIAASVDARGSNRDAWQFAVTAAELLDAGLLITDLRWLIDRELINHAEERTRSGGRRRFRQKAGLSITDRSCFLLTDIGRRFWIAAPAPEVATSAEPAGCPCWDPLRRELTWREVVVKRFRTPARCQELILTVFQEEGWPPRIDNPLGPGRDGQAPHERLHEVVRGLNRRQLQAQVRFFRDGTGEGVRWSA